MLRTSNRKNRIGFPGGLIWKKHGALREHLLGYKRRVSVQIITYFFYYNHHPSLTVTVGRFIYYQHVQYLEKHERGHGNTLI
jgi:hypothetical protein